MSTDSQRLPAYLAALAYALIIGFSFLFMKMTIDTAHPLDVLAHRFLLSTIVLGIPILLGWIKVTCTWRDIWRILPLAMLSPILFFAFQAFGLLYASSAEAGIIQATAPIFTLILATYFLKEQSSWIQKGSLLLSVIGVVFIFVMKGGTNFSLSNLGGILLLVGSALCFAGYGVLARPLTKEYNPLQLTWVTMITACVLFNVVALGRHLVLGTMVEYVQPFAEPHYGFALLYLGILSSLGTTLLSSYALSHLEATKMSVFSNFATITSMIAGSVFLHEQLMYYHIIGTTLIILGVLGTNWGKHTQYRSKQMITAKR
ncbi:DMT family transporter [Paenibacillus nicotianae]|uniref:DMT family transporter n=1 Tax=Paenibacillus nicotianae TaxID=1526551 RepID=A0ABW4UQI2_9BACL